MSVRRGISEIEGIADVKVTKILREMKAVIEGMSGRLPTNPPIKRLGPGASLSGVNNKVNEIIKRIQDET